MRHLVGARVDEYRLRDGMVDCRGSICSITRLTLVEATERELCIAFSAGQLEALGEHEVSIRSVVKAKVEEGGEAKQETAAAE